MEKKVMLSRVVALCLVIIMGVPPATSAQQEAQAPVFKQEELDQLVAPIALYPDSLVSQILMAATYPLEVVQADRFATKNKNLKGDALTKTLEKQTWDPSVKSLVNFPQVLTMMGEKLDWTQKLGDAFLAQQKDVLHTIQSLRAKAQAAGNLKTSKEQKVIVQEKIIVIQPASPQIVYVPTYNPTVVYGAWPYPAYPPYAYYPPGYVATASVFSFAAGVAVGAAWGYAWGHASWGRGNIDIDINRNTNINRNINRNNYKGNIGNNRTGKGTWRHNSTHRKGVGYRGQATAQKYNRGTGSQAAKSRQAYRGRAERGRQDIARGGADQFRGRQASGQRGTGSRGGARDRGGASQLGSRGAASRGGSASRGGAFRGTNHGGSSARSYSHRGSSSRGGSGGRRGGGGRRR
ncbi:MAG: DUF3300 domain-containing protein [bacterium]|nr:DUF3300 domain-containing protein [bacterium]